MDKAAPSTREPVEETESADIELGPEAGPLRLCAVGRVQLPVDEMVRFVAGPDGIVVPDLARRLPGRGVWVELSRARLAEGVRKSVFARSLKRKVTAPADLVERVETLLLKRVLDGLALANKAGLVVSGFSRVDAALDIFSGRKG